MKALIDTRLPHHRDVDLDGPDNAGARGAILTTPRGGNILTKISDREVKEDQRVFYYSEAPPTMAKLEARWHPSPKAGGGGESKLGGIDKA